MLREDVRCRSGDQIPGSFKVGGISRSLVAVPRGVVPSLFSEAPRRRAEKKRTDLSYFGRQAKLTVQLFPHHSN